MKYVAPEMKVFMFEAEEVIVASAVAESSSSEMTYDILDGEEW